MIFWATLYSVVVSIIFSSVVWFFPALNDGAWGFMVSLLISPFLAGYIIHAKDGYEVSNSDRWSYAVLFSLILTIAAEAFIFYYIGTPEGAAILAENNIEANMTTVMVFLFGFALIFLVYLFANRIGFGLGIRYGKHADEIRNKATITARR